MDHSHDGTVRSVWQTLRLLLGLVPLAAGIDKFLNLLTDWPKYLAPSLAQLIPVSPQMFMYVVGSVEIIAGLALLLSPWPRVLGYVVAGWLTGIAVNLLIARFFDIAVRDLAMAITAFSFARLSVVVPHSKHARQPLEALAGAR